jgi:adenylate kinase
VNRRIVLLGPPASGKGTQAELVVKEHGIPSASTGAMMREERARGTELGREMERWTKEGRLFPDEIALRILTNWLDEGHWDAFLLDGFPRTVGQAQAFDGELRQRNGRIDLAISLTLSDEVIRDRILNRVTCARCGATYGMTYHHLKPGDACEDCGSRLERRSDDTPETLDQRLREHRRHTNPVIDYYRQCEILIDVDASAGRDAVFAVISRTLDSGGKK